MVKKKKKLVKKNKPATKQKPEFQEVQVTIDNVYRVMLGNTGSLLKRVDKLQKTVDAIGILLAENAIRKD